MVLIYNNIVNVLFVGTLKASTFFYHAQQIFFLQKYFKVDQLLENSFSSIQIPITYIVSYLKHSLKRLQSPSSLGAEPYGALSIKLSEKK